MNYELIHSTSYEYAAPVAVSHHVARLEPRATGTQTRRAFALAIVPEPSLRQERTDYFGNRLCFFSIQEIHDRLEVVTRSRVCVTRPNLPGLEASPAWEEVARLFQDPVSPEVIEPYQFVFDSPQVRASFELAEYARASFSDGKPLLAGAADLQRRIFEDFKFDPKATTVATPPEEVLSARRGVCQDFAHVAIGCFRSLGLPARYVSGYLRTHAPPGKEKLIGADASHAWLSLYCPGAGWVDFDPTNNAMPADEHITVAYGRDYGDVSPLSGILTGGGEHEVKVAVDVIPLDDCTDTPAGAPPPDS
jgi:transglutaminase-like putative cysteine protease